jgi:hypothetical protein
MNDQDQRYTWIRGQRVQGVAFELGDAATACKNVAEGPGASRRRSVGRVHVERPITQTAFGEMWLVLQ